MKKITIGTGARTATAALAAIIVVAAGTASARASVSTGQADGYGLSLGLNAVGNLATLSVGPAPMATGTAPSPFSHPMTLLSLTANTAGVASVSTGVLNAAAASDVDGSAGSKSASTSAQVDGLGLHVVPGILIIPDLIQLTASTIRSSAVVSGAGPFSAVGGFLIENLSLDVAGIGHINVNANAAPNTVLLDALGIRIVVNEQILTGDNITGRDLVVNAIHITISSILNVVGGDVVIAHSHAALTAVPAPGTAALATLGGCMVIRRRRR